MLCSHFVRHSDFFADEPCKGELVAVDCADRIINLPAGCKVYWCSVCGTEFRYRPGVDQVTIIYIGCLNLQ